MSLARILRYRRINLKEKSWFFVQLSVLLQARVSLHRSLKVLEQQAENSGLRQSIEALGRDIGRGRSFAKALSLQPEVFDRVVVTTAEVGEESGQLPEVLSRLAEHYEKSGILRRKIIQAMTYPALVMSVALCAIVFLLVVIVPTFAEMFTSFQIELPASTQFVLGVSDWALTNGMYFAVAAIVAVIFLRSIAISGRVRAGIELLVWKLPLFGAIVTKSHVARICRTLGTMLSAQVSLVSALQLTRRMISSPRVAGEISDILKSVQRGNTVADPVSTSRIFPPMVAQMIAVGEEASELDAMFIKVAEHYERDVAATVDSLAAVIEPVLVLVLGLMVAAILVAMYLPMFDLMTVVGGAG